MTIATRSGLCEPVATDRFGQCPLVLAATPRAREHPDTDDDNGKRN